MEPLAVRRLTAYLLEAPLPGDPLLADLSGWLAASPRFRAFAEANRDKIRKKARGAREEAARRDLRAELGVASALLADRRMEVAFEAYGAGVRGPDFTVTWRAGPPFNVEVTRRRAGDPEAAIAGPVLAKLRQLPPSRSNVLVVAVDGATAAPDPMPVLHDLRLRADRGEDGPFRSRGLEGAAAFRAGTLRLAAVLAWAEAGGGGERVAAWANQGARIPLPEPTLRAVVAALEAG